MVRPGEGLTPETLTVNERVLLHLRENGAARDDSDAHPLTQPGIAEALGIRVNHVSRAVKQLIRQRLLEEGAGRVRGEVRKRKVYTLTPEGLGLAQRLGLEVGQRTVLRMDGAERRVAASEARKLVAPPTFTRLIAALDAEGRLDLRRPSAQPAREFARFEEGRPRPALLAGREREREALAKWAADGPRILHVLGPRGIGKTSLISAGLPEDRPWFWWTVRPGDRPEAVLNGLAAWLADLGKGDLRTRIAREVPSWREVGKLVARDLRDTNALVVVDDSDAASDALRPYLDALVEAAVAANCRVAVTSETPASRRAELVAQRLLKELRLEGLSREAAHTMFPDLVDAEFEKAYRLTNGNPLSLKLLAEEEMPGDYTPEERALLKVLKMRQDEA
jgi:DNA-binding MarR family transcriptional regulator